MLSEESPVTETLIDLFVLSGSIDIATLPPIPESAFWLEVVVPIKASVSLIFLIAPNCSIAITSPLSLPDVKTEAT